MTLCGSRVRTGCTLSGFAQEDSRVDESVGSVKDKLQRSLEVFRLDDLIAAVLKKFQA